ncbi:MAG: hypothetical protein AAFX76_11700, partial [Planctomycetota bacterium]
MLLFAVPGASGQGLGDDRRGVAVIASDSLVPSGVGGAKRSLADASAIGGDRVPEGVGAGLRVATLRGLTADWDVTIRAPLVTSIREGDVMLASFWARCHESMTGEGVIQFVFERSGKPYNKSALVRFGVREQWKRFHVPFVADDGYGVGEAHATFHLGFNGQVVELAGLEVVNFRDTASLGELPRTRADYAGRAADAPWRAEAERRIDRLRKADLVVTVTGAAGNPVP